MTTQEVRQAVQAAVEAHITHNNFYLDWLVVKDRPTEPVFPCVFWKHYTGRMIELPTGLQRKQLVQLWVLTSVATDRTPEDLQEAVEAAFDAAEDIVMRLKEVLGYAVIDDVVVTTMNDEYTNLLSGVILNFSVDRGLACYEPSHFSS